MKTGVCNLPLHPGSCPKWLFPRMKKLSGLIAEAIVDEYGTEEFLRRIADPFFFQSLSCVIGFDWHSSGTTTTTMGALKESVNSLNLGIEICGGKGATSRKTPSEIAATTMNVQSQKIERLVYSSRMAAKVDSNLVQAGYVLYHHCFVFTENGSWAVVQQGMNDANGYARRYHWLSDNVQSFVEEPHLGICGEKEQEVLDMTARQSDGARKTSLDLVKDNPLHLRRYFTKQTVLQQFVNVTTTTTKNSSSNDDYGDGYELTLPSHHPTPQLSEKSLASLQKAYELQPQNYEELVSLQGIGAKSIRALALVSELVYGAKASWKDPVKYSFAHGGKDGFPYQINREHYDKSIEILTTAIRNSFGREEQLKAIKRLSGYIQVPK
ncbi:MAG: DUF763 domain-containing protein [Candidatus Woesearchaeota archaeon]